MPVDVEPPELARLIDFAERPRAGDWSLRSGLVRYAQPEPERVNQILEHVRRVDAALRGHSKVIQRDGYDLWAALQAGASRSSSAPADTIELLEATAQLDRLGDIVADWAVNASAEPPNAEIDAIIEDVTRRLDALGVPREERVRPPRRQS
jgi:hypothetical protein